MSPTPPPIQRPRRLRMAFVGPSLAVMEIVGLDSAALHGFLIRDAAENADSEQPFHSREKGESPPQLAVIFAPAGG